MKTVKTLHDNVFCEEDSKHAGSARVVEIERDGQKSIGVLITVGTKNLTLPRTRIKEVVEALQQADQQASDEYLHLLRELNQ